MEWKIIEITFVSFNGSSPRIIQVEWDQELKEGTKGNALDIVERGWTTRLSRPLNSTRELWGLAARHQIWHRRLIAKSANSRILDEASHIRTGVTERIYFRDGFANFLMICLTSLNRMVMARSAKPTVHPASHKLEERKKQNLQVWGLWYRNFIPKTLRCWKNNCKISNRFSVCQPNSKVKV